MPVILGKIRGTDITIPVNVRADGSVYIVADALPLPAGGANAANQLIMITSLQLIDDLRNALVSVGLDALSVEQAVHDALNLNANLQVGDVDVSPTNIVPAGLPIGTATPYNVAVALANTEYSQALPATTRAFEFQCRDDAVAIRYAFETGRVAGPVAPYFTLQAGDFYFSFIRDPGAAVLTVYFACATAGEVVELMAWV